MKSTSYVDISPQNANNTRQLWLIEGEKGGVYEIINGVTDFVLTLHDSSFVLKRGHGSKQQKWILEFNANN
jgi:hypothetical protein